MGRLRTPAKITSVLAALGLLVLTGCGQDEDAPAEQGTESPAASASSSATPSEAPVADGTCYDPADVDRNNATAVAQAYVAISYCWDSTVDPNTTAALMRAESLMSPEWAAAQDSPQRNSMQSQFNAAYDHEAYSVPTVERTRGDGDQDVAVDKAVRGVTTKWSWQGRDGATAAGGNAQVMVYLEKHQEWEVVGQQVTIFEPGDAGSW